ncbi:L,D-transpeptidase family protein [Verrucomicrobiales bacterium BCK34]|nr:L,D-transpeptidase family protein [Verrucomicrobiales bacterium BCK34]
MTTKTFAAKIDGLFRLLRCLVCVIAIPLFPAGSTCYAETSTSQIVTVTTSDWTDTTGELNAFEFVGGEWKKVISGIPVTVGKKGMGWGVGLFPDGLKGPQKREGDHRAPAGVFVIESAFGSRERAALKIPYRRTTALDFWVDDSNSKFYNQWVQTRERSAQSNWNSAETLLRKDGLYELAIVVGHNRSPAIAKRGSAIFIHRWRNPGAATIGCTAMNKTHLETLATWLDASKNPLLVQLPITKLDKVSVPNAVRAALN